MSVIPLKKVKEEKEEGKQYKYDKRDKTRPKPDREAKRPYRIWFPKGKAHLAYRCYSTPESALRGACLLAHQLGTVGKKQLELYDALEVVNIRYNRLIGVFVNGVGGVKFISPSQIGGGK